MLHHSAVMAVGVRAIQELIHGWLSRLHKDHLILHLQMVAKSNQAPESVFALFVHGFSSCCQLESGGSEQNGTHVNPAEGMP